MKLQELFRLICPCYCYSYSDCLNDDSMNYTDYNYISQHNSADRNGELI